MKGGGIYKGCGDSATRGCGRPIVDLCPTVLAVHNEHYIALDMGGWGSLDGRKRELFVLFLCRWLGRLLHGGCFISGGTTTEYELRTNL